MNLFEAKHIMRFNTTRSQNKMVKMKEGRDLQ